MADLLVSINRHEEEMQVDPADGPSSEATPPEPVDPLKEAEKSKEAGNTAFRTKKFQEAVERYTEAIGAYFSHFHQTHYILIAPFRLQLKRANVFHQSRRSVHGTQKVQTRTRRLPTSRQSPIRRTLCQDPHTTRAMSALDRISRPCSIHAPISARH